MYRDRDDARGMSLGHGRTGYHSTRSGYQSRYEGERDRYESERYDSSRFNRDRSYDRGRDEGRERGKRYDRARSRSPGRRRRSRSRSRSRSRERLYKERHRMKVRSRTPTKRDRTAPDSEGLRITIRPRNDDKQRQRRSRSPDHYERTRHSKRRSPSQPHSRSSSSSSVSKSRSGSPDRGKAKGSPTNRQSPDESLRITVGNDRYLQKRGLATRLGPPVDDFRHNERNDRDYNQTNRLQSDTHPKSSTMDVIKAKEEALLVEYPQNDQNLPLLGRTLHEDDLYGSKGETDINNTPGVTSTKKQHLLPLIPGVVSNLDIDDEDKFLYGEDDESPKKDPSSQKIGQPVDGFLKLGSTGPEDQGLSHINQYGDQDYRVQSSHRQDLSKRETSYLPDHYRDEHALEQDLYGSPPRDGRYHDSRENRFAAATDLHNQKDPHYLSRANQHLPEVESQLRDRLYRDQDSSENRDLYIQQQYDRPSSVSRNTNGKTDTERSLSSTQEPGTDKPEVDSTLENILKSIGFNFELSKLVQERAQREREGQINPREHGSKKRHSHGDIKGKDADLKMSIDDIRNEDFNNSDETRRGLKRNIIGTAETYEKMAKKYREEQEKAYKDEQRKNITGSMHPLDYLTSRGEILMRKGPGKEKNSEQPTRRGGYNEKYREEGYNKTFERDIYRSREEIPHIVDDPWNVVKHDGTYEKETTYYQEGRSRSRSRSKDNLAFSRDYDERKERKPPILYTDKSKVESPKRHSRSRSPRDRHRALKSDERYNEKRSVSPPDLRNVLVASDKASKRTVLPPKTERSHIQRTLSPTKDDIPERRVVPVLSAKERERLEREKEERRRKLVILESELDKLRKQQGDMMRRKQRQKDGHKDPLLLENSELQEEISKQITMLREVVETQQPNDDCKEQAKAIKFKMEMKAKVDLKVPAVLAESSDDEKQPKTSQRGRLPGPKKDGMTSRSSRKTSATVEDESESSRDDSSSPRKDRRGKSDKQSDKSNKQDNRVKPKFHVNYEFFDPGNHWCRKCNTVSSNVYELFQHLQQKQHLSKMDSHDRPWMPDSLMKPRTKKKKGQTAAVPIKGVEFMMAVQAFYCRMCRVFSGDASCAEHHLKSEDHYKKYQEYTNENPYYEQRFYLEKAAGVSQIGTDNSEKGNSGSTSGNSTQNCKAVSSDESLASEKVKQQKAEIEKLLRDKEKQEEELRKRWEMRVKRAAEQRTEEEEKEKKAREAKEKEITERVRLELPAVGKIGKMTWVKQQQKIQEKIRLRQEEAKEREAAQQKGKLQFSFGRAPVAFHPIKVQETPRAKIDASTFMKNLKGVKEKNKTKGEDNSELASTDTSVSGDHSLPVVTENIPLPQELSKSTKERENDLKLLGIDPDSTSVMDISHMPPAIVAQRSSSGLSPSSSGAAASSQRLFNVANRPTNRSQEPPPPGTEMSNTLTPDKVQHIEGHQVDDMDLVSEGSVSIGDFEVLDEVSADS